ncbi:hypothetical protein Tco_0892813 [Tanacetum coccineum]|uniref:Uncharacterized protein n=1 Tax=Tanacetum coccineum TaxID=301880 RepID=A0ABQ5CA74_9ASTR
MKNIFVFKEYRGPRNQDSKNRNQDNSRRTINVEETSSKAMVAIDGAGFDWSYMADDEVPTNMALMAFSDSEVHNDKTCSKTCLKSFETLKTQLDDLRIELNKSEFNLATYKRGLAFVEKQLVFYKKNDVIFCKQLAVLKRNISYKDSKISMLKSQLEKLKQEKESNQLKIENFDNASKSLDKLIGSQITDKSRKGVGFVSYNAVPPSTTGLFSPLNLDLSYSGLEEFHSLSLKDMDVKLVRVLVKIFLIRSQTPRGNQRNWNNQKSQQLGSDFVMYNKAYFVCGSFDHVHADCNYHQRERVVSGNNYTIVNYNYSAKQTHPSAHRNIVPRSVLMKTGIRPLNTARPVNTAHPKTIVYSARPMSHFSKSAQSTVKRPYQIRTTLTNKNFSQKVNTAKGKFYTARPKAVNTARPNSAVVNAVRANQGHPQKEDQGYVDSGCSRHMTGNMSYLSDLICSSFRHIVSKYDKRFLPKCELEKIKQEKESSQLKIENFDNASKSLYKLIGSQIPYKIRKGLGFVSYNDIPPPSIGLFSPPNLDLSNSGLKEESPNAPLVKELVSDDKLEKKTVFPIGHGGLWPNSAVVNAIRANQVNAVKASACWVWIPTKLNRSYTKEDQGCVDSGYSRHMTENMPYLSDLKEFDGGYVTFVGGVKGGKITGKGTLKIADESQVLLKVLRKNNMYSVDMQNIVPKD